MIHRYSGPYELTFDVLFATREDYDFVKASNVLNKKFVKKSWHIQDDSDILTLMWFQPALAWKCTIKRYDLLQRSAYVFYNNAYLYPAHGHKELWANETHSGRLSTRHLWSWLCDLRPCNNKILRCSWG
jgi:hypothetical protein